MNEKFSTSVIINSYPDRVWTTLTDLKLMTKWLGDTEMNIEVETDWKIDSSIIIRGFHHESVESKGIILEYDNERKLSFTQLDSISQLEDKQENYTILEFILTPKDKTTQLTINIENFPTETIRKHLEFYWRTTVLSIKRDAENQTANR